MTPGLLIGRYRLEERLGQGGMGEVWKAWDTELSRWVALKVAKSVDADDVERFRREAQLAAGLAHPNIAAIYEVGRTGDRPWIAMQYVEGSTLRGAEASLKKRARWVRDAARAVQYAHTQGIIHRDLKPENLMLSGERIFVMDFGLARRIEARSSLTGSGAILGTPAYMSPEQASGDRVDALTDVYGLGAVLYELASRHPPFRGATVMAVLKSVMDDDPLAPASGDAELDAIVLKCLDKERERRYPSAAALADDLDRWIDGEPVEAKPPSAWHRASRLLRKRRALVAVGAAGLAAGVLVAVLLIAREARHAANERRLAELVSEVAELAAWTRQPSRTGAEVQGRGTGLRSSLDQFIAANPLRPEGPHLRAQVGDAIGDEAGALRDAARAVAIAPGHAPSVSLLDWLRVREVAERLRRATSSGPVIRGAEALQAELARFSGLTDPAATLAAALREAVIEKRPEAATARLRDAHARSPSVHYARWIAVWTPGLPEKRELLTKALEIAPFWAVLYWERAKVHVQLEDWEAGFADIERCLALGIRDWTLLADRGYIHMQRGARLEAAGRAADDEWRATLADEAECLDLGGDRFNIRFIIGSAHLHLKEFERAIAELTKSIELEATYVQAYVNRASAHRQRGDNDSAVRDLLKVVNLNPGWPEGRLALGDQYEAMQNVMPAYEEYMAAAKLAPSDPRGHSRCGLILARMAENMRERDAVQALKALQIAIENLETAARVAPADATMREQAARGRRMSAEWFARDGRLDDAAGQRVAALASYDRAVELAPARADLHFHRAATRIEQAAYLRSRERDREAKSLLQGADDDYSLVIRDGYEPEASRLGRGEAKRLLGRPLEALADLDEAVRAGSVKSVTLLLRLRALVDAVRDAEGRGESAAPLRKRAGEDLGALRAAALSESQRKELDDQERRLARR